MCKSMHSLTINYYTIQELFLFSALFCLLYAIAYVEKSTWGAFISDQLMVQKLHLFQPRIKPEHETNDALPAKSTVQHL